MQTVVGLARATRELHLGPESDREPVQSEEGVCVFKL